MQRWIGGSPRRSAAPELRSLLLYVAFKPALSLAREATLAEVALALQWFAASGVWQPLISALGLDPIYSNGAVGSFGSVQVLGLAIADPVGRVAHTVWPSLVLAPDLLASGAAVSLVAAPSASLLARAVSALGADVLWLSLGLVLTRRAHARTWLLVFGLLVTPAVATLETGPHVVRIVEGPAGTWRYPVDGRARIVRGFGYNPQYAGLPAAVRARPDVVLGGLAYTWATNGPEDLDRVFGLVDADGLPLDGALSALSGAYPADDASGQPRCAQVPLPSLGVN